MFILKTFYRFTIFVILCLTVFAVEVVVGFMVMVVVVVVVVVILVIIPRKCIGKLSRAK